MFFVLCVSICLFNVGVSTLNISNYEDVCANKVCLRRCCSNQNQAWSLRDNRCESQNVTLDAQNFTENVKLAYGIEEDVLVLYSDGVLCSNGTKPLFVSDLESTSFGGNRLHVPDYDNNDESHGYLDHCFEFFRSLAAENEFMFSAISCHKEDIPTPTIESVRGNDEIRCDNGKWCVRKCCPKQKVFIEERCVTVSSTLPDIVRAPFLPNHPYASIPAVPRKLCLDEITESVRYNTSMLSFWDNGSIYLKDVKVECGYKDFCLEFFVEDPNERVTFQDVGVIACFSKEKKGIVEMTIYYGMIISMPFLLVTFVVYALLPDRNLHQKALMFYVLTLLIAYILLVTINLSSSFKQPWCSVIAYVTIFSFMSSFFWMNVICFDIWYTFSGGRGFVGSKRSTERRRLIYYSLYALGGPLLILGLIGLMQNVLPRSSYHNPNIGVSKCFLADGWANLWYFYLEAGILVLINVIFFTFTALKIRKVKKETSMLKHNDSQRHSYEKDKQKFNLYVKLLFAMGVNWSMEVISWAVNWRTDSNVKYIWYATDFFNAVYGVFIFFIFVFKKKIWTLLQKRYYNFIGKPHLAHTVVSNQTRTSHYSSTNYSTADTQLTGTNGRPPSEEMGLRTLP